ncbi:hypothetical protein QT196_07305 [Streptomyces sp. P9-2B-2]|nr:hypothetical protein [Streptomyces sp. P9-2B-2]WJY37101.1 hypothetical protein QT196_07305 [Streptomyces sp. P9-2B-2]
MLITSEETEAADVTPFYLDVHNAIVKVRLHQGHGGPLRPPR